jgi:hypothetical protein
MFPCPVREDGGPVETVASRPAYDPVVGRWTASALCVAIGLVVIFSGGLGSATWASSKNPAMSPAQALRTCVDRWNQDNMLGWGPTLVSVSVRRLDAREQNHVGLYDHLRRCTVSLAVFAPRDSRTGCSGYAAMPGHLKSCVSTQTTFVCVVNTVGGYECSRYADGAPSLRNKNATTDERGVLTLDAPLTGTHATAPLAWQRRYPHIDGYIHPWTNAGQLRRGLTFDQAGGSDHSRGTCSRGSEQTHDKSALRCFSDVQFDPCFAPAANWNRRGVVVACADAGWTTFVRFVITRRS